MSRPTSKKESKELLKFFNSISQENQEEQTWELLASCAVIYIFGMVYIFYKLSGY